MKIFVTGTRGIPGIPGGVEKHCQQLYPHLVAKGHEVIVSRRSCYVAEKRASWKGIRLIDVYAPRIRSLEAIVHTFNSLLAARRLHPDVVHIHAVGPALLTPLARLLGFRVVVTNHGPDYRRQKWGKLAKLALRLGEKLGNRFANEVIAISHGIADDLRRRDGRQTNVIYNGVDIQEKSRAVDFLARHHLEPGRYLLSVARLVPEKGLHDLIAAVNGLDVHDWRLLIAGDADHETPYSQDLRRMARQDQRIVMSGYIVGEELLQAFSHAALFVLPSYHEGLPIALLEAMSFELPVLVSDIPPHREVGLPPERYFKCGDVADLKRKLQALLRSEPTLAEKEELRRQIEEKYDWRRIADQTLAVYQKALSR